MHLIYQIGTGVDQLNEMAFLGLLKEHLEGCRESQCECAHIAGSLEGLNKFEKYIAKKSTKGGLTECVQRKDSCAYL
ncbi:hypothetical protein FGO68_gene3860 [Halteria grandinella]|uniref:Uncharacterized protein n=1 Tax=Halteria grandinella TaxID=5974 RepID=A0A8J8NGL5_HALGN|nr:hypothetical protein FGO68_gene3860 [Halteria grandinella]